MLLASVIAALSLLTGPAAPRPAEAGIAVFGRACLSSTPMTRAGLAVVARQQGWQAVSSDTPANLDWRDVYRAGDSVVRLDQHRVSAENPGERICIVAVGAASTGWTDRVSALSVNGSPVGAPGVYDTQRYELPPGLELKVWDLPDGSRIHALREPDNNLELSVNYPTGR